MIEDPFIIRMNIAHYRTMLKLDMDEKKRATIARLLTQAEDELTQAKNFSKPA